MIMWLEFELAYYKVALLAYYKATTPEPNPLFFLY